jgi:hypothetical protein
MDTILDFFDTSAKRWTAVLMAAFLVSVAVLTRSFMAALSPQETTVTVPQSTPVATEQAQARNEPSWNNQPQAQAQAEQGSQVIERVSPFDKDRPKVTRVDPVARQEVVHQQAEYLRGLIAAGKLPKGFGNLTKEQVDEMEKKGVTIN